MIGTAIRLGIVIGHLGRGGAERQLSTLTPGLRTRGIEPRVFCLSRIVEPFGSALRHAGVPVDVIPRLGPMDLARVARLAMAFRRHGIEVAHSFLIDTNLYTVLAARLAGVRRVITSNLNSDFPRGGFRRRLDRLAFRASAIVWVNSERVRRFTVDFFQIPEPQVVVVRQGVDTTIFRPAQNHDEARRRLGLAGRSSAGDRGQPDREESAAAFFRDRGSASPRGARGSSCARRRGTVTGTGRCLALPLSRS